MKRATENYQPNNLLKDGASEIIFEYRGMIYNRPLGRGIVFSEGELAERGLDLEDMIPDGDFHLEVVVRRPVKK